MSADSPSKYFQNNVSGKIVLPNTVEDKSLIGSFAGFIQDVVPQGYCSVSPGENKEKILWARFEQFDMNDATFCLDPSDDSSIEVSPLILVLGYAYGVQIWSITANGEGKELLSWHQGITKILKLIPRPQLDSNGHDPYASQRPLAAICDGSAMSSQFSSVNFLSLRCGDVVKSIKFKCSVIDIVANRIAVVITFVEKIAVFSTCTLENQYMITTCYSSLGTFLNPIALGSRWLAYSEQKVIPWLRSFGGCESDFSQSYTATVISAAKTIGQGLRDLSGSVANSISANLSTSPVSGSNINVANITNNIGSGGSHVNSNFSETFQPGVVTIVDIAEKMLDDNTDQKHGMVAHFVAHSEAIVSLSFDASGMLLFTADKKGHRFNLFRIQAHLLGSAHASVHHLYVLYRGDTTARVQDVSFSLDSRWVAVTTGRGTTHVFPITPYGGPIGIRTHSTAHVVNKLSRFRRSAGIANDGRNSPVLSHEISPLSSSPPLSCPNPCLPPFPHPTVVNALAQIRNPSALVHAPTHILDDGSTNTVRVTACFAPPRSSPDTLITDAITAPFRKSKNSADSLFVMSSQGCLVQYDIEARPASGVPKDRICDESPVEIKVESRMQWCLLEGSASSSGLVPPLHKDNPLMSAYSTTLNDAVNYIDEDSRDEYKERWLSQVEIMTHIGPHRRIWMGPQFTFKTNMKQNCHGDMDSIELTQQYMAKSKPMNMPQNNSWTDRRSLLPLYIESGSGSSSEQSPKLIETYSGDSDSSFGPGELRIQEDIADAMQESPLHSLFKTEQLQIALDFSDAETVDEVQEKVGTKKNRRARRKKK